MPQPSLVLRLELELVAADRGGRRRALRDGYRASMSFGRRRRDVEPVVHDAIVVLDGASSLEPGATATARAWIVDEPPRSLAAGDVFTLLENDRIVARARLLERLVDTAPRPLDDLAAAKRRPLTTVRKHVVETCLEGVRRGDRDTVHRCLTDDVEWDVPPRVALRGRAVLDAVVEDEATAGPPDVAVARLVEEGDVVVAEGSVRAGLAAGGEVDALFCAVVDFRGDRICRVVTYRVDRGP